MLLVRRETLLDFFDDLVALPGEFLVFDDGYRRRAHSYSDVGRASRGFAARLTRHGLRKGDKVLVWGENRPEWIVCYWGCLLLGVVVVPIDYRSSPAFAARVRAVVDARVVVVGDEVPPFGRRIRRRRDLAARRIWTGAPTGRCPTCAVSRDDVTQVIFTSGATAEPKGVVIRHRNVLANVVPVEREVREVPPLRAALPAAALREPAAPQPHVRPVDGHEHPADGARHRHLHAQPQSARRHRPDQGSPGVGAGLRARRSSTSCGTTSSGTCRRPPRPPRPGPPFPARWWRYRRVHRAFGLKFWAFVVGAAPLPPDLEEFWRRMGFAVIQGYGLTETAPIVTLNHPFKTSKGSVGTPIEGVELRIADDGEILVRGENVTSGYYGDAEGALAADGWLHTGDIGERDEQGRVFIKGRKKEMIVTPEGLNVFPEDVERVLDAQPGVRESAVVGVTEGAQERVHAVVVLEEGADLDA